MTEELWIVLLVVAALVIVPALFGLVLILLWWAFIGGVFILYLAIEQGFLGLVAYVACWVFLFPVMLTISIIVGIVTTRAHARERKEPSVTHKFMSHDGVRLSLASRCPCSDRPPS